MNKQYQLSGVTSYFPTHKHTQTKVPWWNFTPILFVYIVCYKCWCNYHIQRCPLLDDRPLVSTGLCHLDHVLWPWPQRACTTTWVLSINSLSAGIKDSMASVIITKQRACSQVLFTVILQGCFAGAGETVWLARCNYSDVIMSAITSQITGVSIVCWAVCSGADRRNSKASLAYVRGIHRWPVDSPHKGSVIRRMSSFDDVIMASIWNVNDMDRTSLSLTTTKHNNARIIYIIPRVTWEVSGLKMLFQNKNLRILSYKVNSILFFPHYRDVICLRNHVVYSYSCTQSPQNNRQFFCKLSPPELTRCIF